MDTECAAHPERAAVYECDGCGKLLCEECIEEGHRLLFCRHCGERALPRTSGVPATTEELARERKQTAPYSLADALAYPFRGLGLYLFVGYVLLLLVFDLGGMIPGLGCAIAVFQAVILFILPGFLFAIVRSSAEGETELPDWADWSEVGERFGEWFAFLLVMVMAALPTYLLLRLGGCGLGGLVLGEWGFGCWALVALGVMAGVTLWVPGVGAVGTYTSGWLGWRADLHIKALIAVRDDAWKTIALLTGLWLASLILRVVLAFLPVMGAITQIGVGVYALLTGAHLIGLLFRRNTKMLEAIYLG
jgi:hypothetical protein